MGDDLMWCEKHCLQYRVDIAFDRLETFLDVFGALLRENCLSDLSRHVWWVFPTRSIRAAQVPRCPGATLGRTNMLNTRFITCVGYLVKTISIGILLGA